MSARSTGWAGVTVTGPVAKAAGAGAAPPAAGGSPGAPGGGDPLGNRGLPVGAGHARHREGGRADEGAGRAGQHGISSDGPVVPRTGTRVVRDRGGFTGESAGISPWSSGGMDSGTRCPGTTGPRSGDRPRGRPPRSAAGDGGVLIPSRFGR